MLNFSRQNVEHSDSFIRASATELLFELLFFDQNLRHQFAFENFVRNIFLFETEAIVRRLCAKMLIKFGAENPEIRKLMIGALLDLDWEVKEEVRCRRRMAEADHPFMLF